MTAVTISYSIARPNAAEAPAHLKADDSLSFPLKTEGDALSNLQAAMTQAAEAVNSALTEWKDVLGQSEKEKERKVESDARLALEARKANGTADEESEDEEEEA